MTDAIERITLITCDITNPPSDLHVDAIVNAANESLLGGSGVDGAIHRAAGPGLLEHNKMLDGCVTGLAKVTPAFDLGERGIKHILHAVGPVWPATGDDSQKLGYTREDVLLASCYTRCLELAAGCDCHVLAFPEISTGIYHFPKIRAAKIALGHVLGYLKTHELPQRIVFCCFSEADTKVYHDTLDNRDQWMLGRKRI